MGTTLCIGSGPAASSSSAWGQVRACSLLGSGGTLGSRTLVVHVEWGYARGLPRLVCSRGWTALYCMGASGSLGLVVGLTLGVRHHSLHRLVPLLCMGGTVSARVRLGLRPGCMGPRCVRGLHALGPGLMLGLWSRSMWYGPLWYMRCMRWMHWVLSLIGSMWYAWVSVVHVVPSASSVWYG